MRIALLGSLVVIVACAKAPQAENQPTPSASAPAVDDTCPRDLLAARGTPCTKDGKTCTAGPGSFTHLLMCSRGTWTEMNAPPPPPH